MNITIHKKDLLRILSRGSSVASRKSTLPALAAVLLTASGSTLRADATDMFLSVTDTCGANVENPGSCAVSARDIVPRVASMPEGQLKLSLDAKGILTIKAGGSSPRRFTLPTVLAADFPELPSVHPDAPSLTINPAELARLIGLVKVSIALDETRPHLNSTMFEWTSGRVRMVSTNGHMLSVADHAIANETTASMLVPLRAISEVLKIIAGVTEPVAMRPSKDRLFFDVGSVRFGAKLAEGQFPPYQQVIPKHHARTIKASREAIVDSCSAVQLAASASTHAVRITVGNGMLRITSENPDAGQAEDEVGCDGGEGAPTTYGFAAHYIVDTLNAMTCGTVTIGFGASELDPMVVRPDVGDDHLAVIMPMKI